MEVFEARRDLSSTAPSHVAQGFLFFLLHIFSFLYLSYANTREHACFIVQHAYSLHVHGNPGNLLTSPSSAVDHSHIAAVIPSVPSLPCSVIPSSRVSCSSAPIQSAQLQTLSQFVIITLFAAETLRLVSSPFCDQTHHLPMAQSSVFRDSV